LGATDQWRWTDDQGVQRLLGAAELRAALASGRLAPTVLVWKRGMSGWMPAREVPELMPSLDEARKRGSAPSTSEQPRTLGARAEPTPSIPPPDAFPPLEAFTSARASSADPTPRGLATTMAGIGDDRPKEKPDGGWKSGAARPDEEETVTRVRLDDEPSTVAESKRGGEGAHPPRSATRPWGLEAASRQAARARVGKGPQPSTRSPYKSVPTMRPRMPSEKPLPPSVPPPPPERRPSIPPAPKRSTPPPPVKSSAVLSEAFPSGVGRSRAPRTEQLDDGWVLGDAQRRARNRAARSVEQPGAHGLIDDDSEVVTQLSDKEARPAHTSTSAKRPPEPKRRPPERRGSGKPVVKVPPDEPRAPAPRPPPAKASPTPGASPPVEPRPASKPSVAKSLPKTQPLPVTAPALSQEAPRGAGPLAAPSSQPGPQAGPTAPEPRPRSQPRAEERPAPRADAPAALGGVEGIPGARLAAAGLQSSIKTEMPPSRRSSRRLEPTLMVGAVGAALVLVLLAFYVGRVTAPAEAGLASTVQAKSGMAVVPLFARSRATEANQRPCLMLRAPSMFASSASHRVPFETATQGDRLLVGYARSAFLPRGMVVAPGVGKAETVLEPEEDLGDSVSRVVPIVKGDAIEWGTTLREQKQLTESAWVNAPTPFVLGFEGDRLVRRDSPEGASTTLWKLGGKGPADAMRGLHVPGKGTIVAYRQGNRIYHGALKLDGSVWLEATAVAGSGGIVGKPDLASNGTRVVVVFADKPAGAGAQPELRWSFGELGQALGDATVVTIPEGGPGGESIAPAVASLSGGRWLLLWTEGRAGARTLRAQTYDGMFRPIGQALRVSPATGSFGQGTVAAVGGDAVVLFLLATAQSYEVWGTVLQCR
jgi:hypothetical protein